jgi:hypothetical protein
MQLGKLGYGVILMVGSFVEMWAAGAVCDSRSKGCSFVGGTGCANSGNAHDVCTDEYGYAVAIGVISLFFSIVLLLINRFAPGVANGIVEMVIIIPLAICWFAAMACTTMGSTAIPWGAGGAAYGSNGYYTTWLCTIVSGLLVLEYSPMLVGLVGKMSGSVDLPRMIMLGIALASLILMWSASKICSDTNGDCDGMVSWAIACGVISLFFSLIWGLVPPLASTIKFVAIFLALWWIAAICTLTMPNANAWGVFIHSGNGFFATWFCCFASIYLCAASWADMSPSVEGGDGTSEPQVESMPGGDTEAIPPASDLEVAPEINPEDTAKV